MSVNTPVAHKRQILAGLSGISDQWKRVLVTITYDLIVLFHDVIVKMTAQVYQKQATSLRCRWCADIKDPSKATQNETSPAQTLDRLKQRVSLYIFKCHSYG